MINLSDRIRTCIFIHTTLSRSANKAIESETITYEKEITRRKKDFLLQDQDHLKLTILNNKV